MEGQTEMDLDRAKPASVKPRPTSSKRRNNEGRVAANAKALATAERRLKVAEYIAAGVPYRKIASILGVALSTIALDKSAVLEEWQHCYVGAMHEHIVLDLYRIEQLIMNLTLDMKKDPDPRIRSVYIQALKRKAEMLGLDASARVKAPIHIPGMEIEVEAEQISQVDANGNPVGKGAAAQLYAAFLPRREEGDGER